MAESNTPTKPTLCSCCERHGGFRDGSPGDEKRNYITDEVVTCPECGEPCSCDGCVADVHEPERLTR